jgi:hypothetical protein
MMRQTKMIRFRLGTLTKSNNISIYSADNYAQCW